MTTNRQYIFDANLELKDAGLVAASAAGTVGGSAVVRDIGEGFIEGTVVVDVTAIEIASNDEVYTIILEGSTSSTAASTIVPLAMLQVGAQEVILGGCDVDSTIGRYFLHFNNERDGVNYRYARIYTVVAGTIATGGGINYSAWISKKIGG